MTAARPRLRGRLGLPLIVTAALVAPGPARAECAAADRPSDWLEALMRTDPQRRFAALLPAAAAHRIQISLAEVIDTGEERCLRRSGFRVDAEYFYPASAIKIVAAVAALDELESLRATHPELSVDSELIVRPAVVELPGGGRLPIAPSSPPQTLRRVIWETLAPSSNVGFNWLFDVAGPARLNGDSWRAGFTSVRLRHRLAERAFPVAAQRYAPPLAYRSGNAEIELRPLRSFADAIPPPTGKRLLVGRAHQDPASGELIARPFDFTEKNAVSLTDLQSMLIDVVRPELSGRAERRFPLAPRHRDLLVSVMSEILTPDEPPAVPDRIRYKPLLTGIRRAVGARRDLRYVNKAGRAYGFLIDNAYVEDRASKRAFFIAAVIYANPNDVVGDDQYAYDEISFPFMEALGERLARVVLAVDG